MNDTTSSRATSGRLRRFRAKYDFPIHLRVMHERLMKEISEFLSTLRARAALWLHGARAGTGFRTDGPLWIRADRRGALCLGVHVHLNARVHSNPVGIAGPMVLDAQGDGRIIIGDHTGITASVISARNEVRIGSHVNIGANVRIFDHDWHALDWRRRRLPQEDKLGIATAPVAIGDDVFIGTNAMILKGVCIGDRAIIGAGAVVTRNVPSGEVWAGNPAARVVRRPEGKAP